MRTFTDLNNRRCRKNNWKGEDARRPIAKSRARVSSDGYRIVKPIELPGAISGEFMWVIAVIVMVRGRAAASSDTAVGRLAVKGRICRISAALSRAGPTQCSTA